MHPDDIERAWEDYQEAYNSNTTLNHEYRMVHEDGTIRWVLEQAFPIDDENGSPWLIQGVIFDITERKNAEEQVAFLAYHDKLTGLPNRALFEEMLESAIARARRNDAGGRRAVPGPGQLQDGERHARAPLGRPAARAAGRPAPHLHARHRPRGASGRRRVPVAAQRSRRATRRPTSTPALATAEMVANRVREALAEPFDLHGTQFLAAGSIGISLFPHDAQDAETLMKNADAAMYRTKRHGARGASPSSTTGDLDPAQQFSLTTRLREAVREERWVLHWQPIVDIATGQIESLEALIRWQDPKGGLVPPLEFIPLAEELGLIEAIGDWVIAELVRQQSEWRDAGPGPAARVQPLAAAAVVRAPGREGHGARCAPAASIPDAIIVEITESTAMADPDRTQKILSELHAWGFTLALDDFGTGYSSLARLKHMPVDVLKIDRAFVHDVHNDMVAGEHGARDDPTGARVST